MVHKVAVALAALALPSAILAAPKGEWGRWQCEVETQTVCRTVGPCIATNPALTISVEPPGNRYERCTAVGEDKFGDCFVGRAVLEESGEYLTAKAVGSAVFIRISSDLHFTDVATLGHDVYVSRGTCTDGPPAIRFDRPAP